MVRMFRSINAYPSFCRNLLLWDFAIHPIRCSFHSWRHLSPSILLYLRQGPEPCWFCAVCLEISKSSDQHSFIHSCREQVYIMLQYRNVEKASSPLFQVSLSRGLQVLPNAVSELLDSLWILILPFDDLFCVLLCIQGLFKIFRSK